MERVLATTVKRFGEETAYSRPNSAYPAFTVRGIVDRDPHLESQDRGPFTAITYRLADFDKAAPFHASVDVTMKNIPGNGTYITIDGITYTFRTVLTQGTPYEVARGVNSAEAALNLTAAINASPDDSGIRFSSATTAHPTCQASCEASVVRIEYIEPGTVGDNKIVREAIYGTSVSSNLLSGGGPKITDEVTLADGIVYRVGNDGIGYDGEGGVKLRLFPKTT